MPLPAHRALSLHAQSRRVALGALTLAVAAALAPAARAQEDTVGASLDLPSRGALVADGDVDSLSVKGPRAYLRGSFAHLGYYTGPTAVLDPASGAVSRVSARLNGQVSDAITDGRGGMFVAGDFTAADGVPHKGLAHILPGGTVDQAFTGDTDGRVWALERDGDRLFLAGDFTMVSGEPRRQIGAVDTATGRSLPFAASGRDPIHELALAPASDGVPARLYAGNAEDPLLAVDAATGTPVPGFDAGPAAPVSALAVGAGRLYVGGASIRALDPATGRPMPGFTGAAARGGTAVHVLLLDGDRLLAGGDFGSAYGGSGSSLIAIDPVSGATRPGFAPRIGPDVLDPRRKYTGPGRPDTALDAGVFDLARIGDELWVGGRFASVSGKAAENLVVLDAASGAPKTRALPYLGGQVNALAPATGGRLLLGGNFQIAGARAVAGLAAVDPVSLAVDPGFGSPRGHDVRDELLVGPEYLFGTDTGEGPYGGEVPRFAGSVRNIEVRRTSTGAMVRPGIRSVRNLTGFALYGNDAILVRRLENRPAFPRNVIEIRDPASGRIKRSFPVPLRGYVQTIVVHGNDLYLGGSFRRKRRSGQQANLAVLRMSATTGRLYDGFDPHVHGPVDSILVDGTRIALSGTFDKIPGRRVSYRVTLNALYGFSFADPLPASLFPGAYNRFTGPGHAYLFQSSAVGSGRRLVTRSVFDLPTGGEDRGGLTFVTSAKAL